MKGIFLYDFHSTTYLSNVIPQEFVLRLSLFRMPWTRHDFSLLGVMDVPWRSLRNLVWQSFAGTLSRLVQRETNSITTLFGSPRILTRVFEWGNHWVRKNCYCLNRVQLHPAAPFPVCLYCTMIVSNRVASNQALVACKRRPKEVRFSHTC